MDAGKVVYSQGQHSIVASISYSFGGHTSVLQDPSGSCSFKRDADVNSRARPSYLMGETKRHVRQDSKEINDRTRNSASASTLMCQILDSEFKCEDFGQE